MQAEIAVENHLLQNPIFSKKLGYCYLNDKNSRITINYMKFQLNILVKIHFTRRYIDETESYHIATELSDCQNNRILNVEKRMVNNVEKKVYIYENNYRITRIFNIENFENKSVESVFEDLKNNIKVYPFMKNHEIIFDNAFVCISSENSQRKLNRFIYFNVTHLFSGKRIMQCGKSTEELLYMSPLVTSIKDGDYIKEILGTIEAEIKII